MKSLTALIMRLDQGTPTAIELSWELFHDRGVAVWRCTRDMRGITERVRLSFLDVHSTTRVFLLMSDIMENLEGYDLTPNRGSIEAEMELCIRRAFDHAPVNTFLTVAQIVKLGAAHDMPPAASSVAVLLMSMMTDKVVIKGLKAEMNGDRLGARLVEPVYGDVESVGKMDTTGL